MFRRQLIPLRPRNENLRTLSAGYLYRAAPTQHVPRSYYYMKSPFIVRGAWATQVRGVGRDEFRAEESSSCSRMIRRTVRDGKMEHKTVRDGGKNIMGHTNE
jgi:hypothetical protein